MAGYSRAFWIGEPGGFQGADGINPIHVEILVGDADRQWWELGYSRSPEYQLGKLTRFVPAGPDDDYALLDACLAFYARPFRDLPSFGLVQRELSDATFLDFHSQSSRVPVSWISLRAEAYPRFRKLFVMEGRFSAVDLSKRDA